MKMVIRAILVIFFVLFCAASSQATFILDKSQNHSAPLFDSQPFSLLANNSTTVYIEPAIPTKNHDITVFVSGLSGYGGVRDFSSSFLRNGYDLRLNIYYKTGMLPVVTRWYYSTSIGQLPEGTYDLLVKGGMHDGHLQFTVVPEPTSIILLSLGVAGLYRRRKIRSR